jgi:hypothetical protein
MAKSEDHCPLFMPPWTLEELQEARLCLEGDLHSQENLGGTASFDNSQGAIVNTSPPSLEHLTAEVVEERFSKFGGSARYCLTRSSSFYSSGLALLNWKCTNIESLRELEDKRRFLADSPHHLLFIFPVTEYRYVFDFGSPYIRQRIFQRVLTRSVNDLKKVISTFAGMPRQFQTMSGNVFEAVCHSVFGGKYGGFLAKDLSRVDRNRTDHPEFTLKLLKERALSEPPAKKPRSLVTTQKTETKIASDIKLRIDPELYKPAEKHNEESIDAFYQDGDNIYLLQMTLASSHPVSGEGIHKALCKLDPAWTKGLQAGKRVVLVFVVDSSPAVANFGEQRIKFASRDPIETQNVSEIHGIGPANTRILAGRNIHTVDQVKRAMSAMKDGKLTPEAKRLEASYKNRLDEHLKPVDEELQSWIQDIPQYRITMAYDFSDPVNPCPDVR